MREVGNSSNLILDPQMGSYYLVNIIINLAPALQLASQPALQKHISDEIDYSLAQIQKSGIDTQSLVAILTNKIDDTNTSKRLYDNAAQMLERELRNRYVDTQWEQWEVITIIVALFFAFSVLLSVAMRYHLKSKLYSAAEEKLLLMDQLEKTCSELEHFSYFTAHDLKEPVRTIACFAALIEEDGGGAVQKRYIAVIRETALRMERLINDVFAYLSGGARSESEEVNVSEVLKEVQDDLQPLILESSAQFSAETLPVIFCNRLIMHRVLQNVISNAIYYQKPGIVPHIRVAADKREDGWLFVISDNGIGFDMKYAKQVFEPFKRLHNGSVKGSGIGLSICKKLLAGIGGDIWVNSIPGVGTDVVFVIPQT